MKNDQNSVKTKTVSKTASATSSTTPSLAAGAAGDELLQMDDAIALLKTTRPTFYRWLRAGKIKGMKVGREWRFYRADIERFLQGEEPRIEAVGDVAGLMTALSQAATAHGLTGEFSEAAAPIPVVVNCILHLASATNASDIHLQPPSDSDDPRARLRFRVHGSMLDIATFDSRVLPAIIERLKTMAACDVQQKRRPQDGRVRLSIQNQSIDLRASFIPALLGEAATLRLLRPEAASLRMPRLGYSPADDARVRRALALPWGMILVTGPTGSGKTTALYAMLNEVNTPDKKIMTVEDPVEYSFPGVVQVPVNVRENLTFAAALRSVIRSDADIILVGELRDGETVNTCAQIVLTGHMVLSTLHTDEAVTALTRLIDMGLDAFVLIDAVKLVVAQRLMRALCSKCSEPTTLAPDQLALATRLARKGGKPWDKTPIELRKSVGCRECSFTGFRGRMAVAETLAITPPLAAAVRTRTSVEELRCIAVAQGMTTMMADGLDRAAQGLTTVEEVFRTLPHGE